jgi:hypothetical protein
MDRPLFYFDGRGISKLLLWSWFFLFVWENCQIAFPGAFWEITESTADIKPQLHR